MSMRDAGGTEGGLGEFVGGAAMAAVGLYLLLSKIWVTSSWFGFFGEPRGGVLLLGVLVGFGFIFANGRSVVGWLLVAGCLGFSIVQVIMTLDLRIHSMPLWELILIFVLVGGGLGLVVKSLMPHRARRPSDLER